MTQTVIIGRVDFSQLSGPMRLIGSQALQVGDQIAENESAYVMFVETVAGESELIGGILIGVSSVAPRCVGVSVKEPDFTLQVSAENPDIVDVTLPQGERIQLAVNGLAERLDAYPFILAAFASVRDAIEWYEARAEDNLSPSRLHYGPGLSQLVRYDW